MIAPKLPTPPVDSAQLLTWARDLTLTVQRGLDQLAAGELYKKAVSPLGAVTVNAGVDQVDRAQLNTVITAIQAKLDEVISTLKSLGLM